MVRYKLEITWPCDCATYGIGNKHVCSPVTDVIAEGPVGTPYQYIDQYVGGAKVFLTFTDNDEFKKDVIVGIAKPPLGKSF